MPIRKYPISLPRNHSHNKRNANKIRAHNELAREVENWINDKMKDWPDGKEGVFEAYNIARDLGVETEEVSVVLSYDNGITVQK